MQVVSIDGNATGSCEGCSSPPPNFASSAITYPEIDIAIGNVPSVYANYNLVRHPGFLFERSEDITLNLSTQATCVYGHPTELTDNTGPSWLSTWTYTGNDGDFGPPDRDGVAQTVTVRYYSKLLGAGNTVFTDGFRPPAWDDRLKFLVGWWLCPSSTTVTTDHPLGEIITDVSAAYADTAFEAYYYDTPVVPTVPGACDTRTAVWATAFVALGTAAAGDIVCLQTGVYTDQGRENVANTNGTFANPIQLVLEDGAVLDGDTSILLTGDNLHVHGGKVTALTTDAHASSTDGRIGIDECDFCLINGPWADNAGAPTETENDAFFVINGFSRASRITACTVDGNSTQQPAIRTLSNTIDGYGWHRVDHCRTEDIVESAGNDNQALLVGSTAQNGTDLGGVLIDHNYVTRFDENSSANREMNGQKMTGAVFWSNFCDDSKGTCVSIRVGGESVSIRNIRDGTNCTGISNCVLTRTEGNWRNNVESASVVGDYSIDGDGGHGQWRFPQSDAADSNNETPDDVLVIGTIAYLGTDSLIVWSNGAADNQTTNFHVQGMIGETSGDFVDDQANIPATWGGTCRDSSQGAFGITPLPTGVTEQAVAWADRGDGMIMPTCAGGFSLGDYLIPYELEDTTDIVNGAGSFVTGAP